MDSLKRLAEIQVLAQAAQEDDNGISLNLLEATGTYIESYFQETTMRSATELHSAIERYQQRLSNLKEAIALADQYFAEWIQKNVSQLSPTLSEQERKRLQGKFLPLQASKQ